MKVQPHREAFIKLPDPRNILENELRNFICISKGDTIRVNYINEEFDLDVLEIKPQSSLNCICTINTDVEVDFAPPLDYEELPNLNNRQHSLNVKEEEIKEGIFLKFPFVNF